MSLKMTIDYPDTIPGAIQETRMEFEKNGNYSAPLVFCPLALPFTSK